MRLRVPPSTERRNDDLKISTLSDLVEHSKVSEVYALSRLECVFSCQKQQLSQQLQEELNRARERQESLREHVNQTSCRACRCCELAAEFCGQGQPSSESGPSPAVLRIGKRRIEALRHVSDEDELHKRSDAHSLPCQSPEIVRIGKRRVTSLQQNFDDL
eukprot:CAMPEP_0185840964 /NCGR_PEP_ID=MMETSP1353-20130828/17099_1 /TAXON_ID=1077150 /ORGANISM="Erythrolobus australicus, Strain CCMP3124" /LENGTH=159 /DNA_ID=CAMNT_0028540357 /DNA_START=480 /DNA_END=959 /DNA_ORIENTATION=-